MARQRPRRALQAPWQVRVARVAVPSLLVGLGTTGVVAVATGSTAAVQATSSASAPAPTVTAAQSSRQEQVTSRDFVRPSLTGAQSAAAAEDAAKVKAAAKTKAAAKAKAKAAADKATAKAKAKATATAKAKAEKARAADRPSLTVVDTEYTRVALNVREQADAGSDLLTVLEPGSKVSVTATVRGPWQHVAYRGRSGWVKDQYLVESKPKPKPVRSAAGSDAGQSSGSAGGVSSAACPGGSSVESGLSSDAVRLHRALCARFPGVTSYGGVRADSLPAHPSGRALDAMVSSNGLGQQIADWVRANAQQLGVSEVIFARRIWTVQRGSEGWRSMSDRGSPSANHEDHVHVTVYGNAGR